MTAICSICQEKLQSGGAVALSRCGHVLCDGCLLQWASRSNPSTNVDCPMCRKRHTYPKHTIKLYFEEEKSEVETFRSEIRSVMKLVQKCAQGPSGASLAGVVNDLKNLSSRGKKIGDSDVTAANISGLDAMVSHLSKKLAPMQSTEELQADLELAMEELERSAVEKSRLMSQHTASQSRMETLARDAAAAKRDHEKLLQEVQKLSADHAAMQEQLSRQRSKNAVLQQQLSTCQESRENALEKVVAIKKKVKNLSDANASLKRQVNSALSGRRPSIPPTSHSAPRVSRRGSIISIRSQSSPDTRQISVISSDDDRRLPSESSSVEFISDTENNNDPTPHFRELKLKPVKAPTLFQHMPQASSSKAPTSRSVQKRKLATAPPGSAGLELRNGKLTGLVATGPKRSKRC